MDHHRLAGEPELRPVVTATSTRWLTELHPDDRRAYARAVHRVTGRIDRVLGAGVMANRTDPAGALLPVGPALLAWRDSLASLDPGCAAVVSDVRRCFASIEPHAVDRSLAAAGVGPSERHPIVAFLEATRAAGLRGLPVGPEPSAILANVVLGVADRAAEHAGGRVLRWVDDVVLLAPSVAASRRVFDAWAGTLHELGLAPHDGKFAAISRIGERPEWGSEPSRARRLLVP